MEFTCCRKSRDLVVGAHTSQDSSGTQNTQRGSWTEEGGSGKRAFHSLHATLPKITSTLQLRTHLGPGALPVPLSLPSPCTHSLGLCISGTHTRGLCCYCCSTAGRGLGRGTGGTIIPGDSKELCCFRKAVGPLQASCPFPQPTGWDPGPPAARASRPPHEEPWP